LREHFEKERRSKKKHCEKSTSRLERFVEKPVEKGCECGVCEGFVSFHNCGKLSSGDTR
jgi:hypothetical protein